jgi:hypothetical protein
MEDTRFEVNLGPGKQAAFSSTRDAEMSAMYNSGIIEWHCEGRHGVVRNIANKAQMQQTLMLNYFFGDRCAWDNQKGELEFVHMTKVYPAPTKPWQWCGTTVLFNDWKVREETAQSSLQAFKIGDRVRFEYKGRRFEGLVAGKNKRCTVVVEGSEVVYYIPATSLTKVA